MATSQWDNVTQLLDEHKVAAAIEAARALVNEGTPLRDPRAIEVLCRLRPMLVHQMAAKTLNEPVDVDADPTGQRLASYYPRCGAVHPERPEETCVVDVTFRRYTHKQHVSANGYEWPHLPSDAVHDED